MKIEEFYILMEQVEKETVNLSACWQILENESVKLIIELGEIVVPLILRRYENNKKLIWSLILFEITNVDLPVEGFLKKTNFSKPNKVQKAWIKWGKSKNLI